MYVTESASWSSAGCLRSSRVMRGSAGSPTVSSWLGALGGQISPISSVRVAACLYTRVVVPSRSLASFCRHESRTVVCGREKKNDTIRLFTRFLSFGRKRALPPPALAQDGADLNVVLSFSRACTSASHRVSEWICASHRVNGCICAELFLNDLMCEVMGFCRMVLLCCTIMDLFVARFGAKR